MAKVIVSVSALFIYGSISAASVWRAPFGAFDARDDEVPAVVEVEEIATSDATTPVPTGEMSEQEKNRRRDVCARIHDQCYDRCTSFYSKKRNRLTSCYRRCANDLAECMKEIRK